MAFPDVIAGAIFSRLVTERNRRGGAGTAKGAARGAWLRHGCCARMLSRRRLRLGHAGRSGCRRALSIKYGATAGRSTAEAVSAANGAQRILAPSTVAARVKGAGNGCKNLNTSKDPGAEARQMKYGQIRRPRAALPPRAHRKRHIAARLRCARVIAANDCRNLLNRRGGDFRRAGKSPTGDARTAPQSEFGPQRRVLSKNLRLEAGTASSLVLAVLMVLAVQHQQPNQRACCH
jgi:hypothetical protein